LIEGLLIGGDDGEESNDGERVMLGNGDNVGGWWWGRVQMGEGWWREGLWFGEGGDGVGC
jgi:hypothetical protein